MNNKLFSERVRGFLSFLVLFLFFTFLPLTAYGAGGDIAWQYGDAKSGKQESKAMAVDSSGNIIITGYQLLSGTDNDFYTVKIKADGSGPVWPAASYNKSGNDDQATAVAVDSSDNIVVTGFVQTAANFDFHTIKYNGSTGAVLWQHTFNGSANGNDEATSVAVDSLNNIYVGGHTRNSSGNDDYLLLKYSPDGTLLWQQTYTGTANGQDGITAITAGSDGIGVTGYSWNGTDFDYLTLKYGFDGAKLWDKRYSSTGTNNDRGLYVKMDSSGNVVVTGYTANGTDMDIYTAKYSGPTGALLWETPYNGGYDDEPRGLWLGPDGKVYVTGYTWTLAGHYDFYTAKYNGSTGALIWGQTYNSGLDNDDIATGIAVDSAGDVFVTGYTTSAGNFDFRTLKHRQDNGNQLWQSSFNGSANKNDRPVGLGLSPTGEALVAGWSDLWTSGASDYDYYVIKYEPGLLDAPTNLTGEAVSETEVHLAWTDNSANEDGLSIERKIGEFGTYNEIKTVGANVTAYNDNDNGAGLVPHTKYYYRVRAYNAANGNSHYTNEAAVLTTIVSYQAPTSYIYDGDGSDDYATAIAVGPDNNPVVTGYSFSTVGVFDYYTLKLNRTNGSVLWPARYDDADNDLDAAMCVSVDSNNEVVVSGYASFYSAAAGQNTNDVYTVKYPAAGEPELWHDSYDGPAHSDDRSTAVATAADGSNNIVVVGYGRNAAFNDDIYVLKYLADGTRAWTATPYDGPAHGNDYPTGVAFDSSNNIFVTGYTHNGTNDDFFTRKYDTDGNVLWTDTFSGGYGEDETKALAVDSSGNLYVTGYITNSSGNEDFYTIKYSGAGSRLWERSVDRGGNDRAKSVRIDSIDGNIVVAGTSFTGSGNNDYHIVRYDADGNIVWQKTLDRPSNDDDVVAMGMDLSGNICVAGETSAGTTTDIVSVKYDYEGNIIGATSFNGSGDSYDHASSIAVNSYGEAFIAGDSMNAGGTADYVILKCAGEPLQVPAPFNLTPLYTSITLTWADNSMAEDGYRLERKLGVCTAEDISNICNPGDAGCLWTWSYVTSPNTISYNNTGLNISETYCYRIKAFKNNGETSRWIGKSGTTLTPGAPGSLTATVVSTTQINLSWTDNTTGETGFEVWRCEGTNCNPKSPEDGGDGTLIYTASTNTAVYSDTGVCKSTTYGYQVRAFKTGEWETNYSNATGDKTTPTPGVPVLTATRASEVQINLSWNDNNSDETGYKIDRCSDAACAAVLTTIPVAANTTAYSDTGLTAGTIYYYRVRAYKTATCGWDNAFYSNIANATTTIVAPGSLAATAANTTQINLAWTDNTASETGFTIERCAGAGCDFSVKDTFTVGANVITYSDASVCNSTTYSYRVKAVNSTVPWDSAYSNVDAGNTTPTPGVPVLTAARASEVQINLAWNDNNSDETGYKIERCSDVACGTVLTTIPVVANTIAYSDTVTPETTYYYRVRAYKTATCGWDNAFYSNIANATTTIVAPSGLAATAANTTQINLAWVDNTASETGFTIERCTGAGCDFSVKDTFTVGANVIAYSDTSVCNSTAYSYQVKAVNEGLSNNGGSCWTRRTPLTISSFQSDYQTRITVTYDTDMQPDFEDIRFYDTTSSRELPYWIESKTDGGSATVWVKTGSNNNIYMYYGNASALSASNGAAVFEFFDNFRGSSIDTVKWAEIDPDNSISQNNDLVLNDVSDAWTKALISKQTFSRSADKKIYMKMTIPADTAGNNHFMVGWDANQTTNPSYAQLVHGFYWNNYLLSTYEKGNHTGPNTQTYAASTDYEMKVELKSSNANYYIKGGAYANWTQVVPSTVLNYTDSSMRIAFTQYSHQANIHFVTVQKYVATEPDVTAGAEEQSACFTYSGMWASSPSNTATAATPTVTAPGGFTATGVSESQINLAWTDNTTDETGFKIERCSGAGCSNFAEINAVGSGVTAFNDSGIASGTYVYRVKAYKSGVACAWDSVYSDTAETATLLPPPPGGLAVTSANTTQVNLSWNDNTGTESGFRIDRCTGAACDFTTKNTFFAAANTSATAAFYDRYACNSNAYQYRVDAYKDKISNSNSGCWNNRIPITFTSSADLTDYQVRVDLPFDTDTMFSLADIRFTDSDGSTELSYWHEGPQKVLASGTTGSFDDTQITVPVVINDGGTYKMWYSGYNATNWKIGYATSADGINWTKYGSNPVLTIGAAGSMDSTHVGVGTVIKDGALYKMWYYGHDGIRWRVMYATSTDGIAWTKYNSGNPVLDVGLTGSYDSWTLGVPSVIKEDATTYKMWYSANNGANARVAYATSSDGITWTKYNNGNPVLDIDTTPGAFDSLHAQNARVIKDGSVYRMWYSGSDNVHWRIMYAESGDGIAWTKKGVDLTYAESGAGWDASHASVPWVMLDSNKYKMWYAAHDGSNWKGIGYMERGNSSAPAPVWVKVPSLTNGVQKTIYMYYGNRNATTSRNGANTFDFFDDFAGTSLEATKWTATGAASVADDRLTITTGAVYSNNTVTSQPNLITEARMKWTGAFTSYSGLEMASIKEAVDNNTNSNKLVLFATSNSTANVNAWAADGAAASYNLTSGTSQFTATADTSYILGSAVTDTQVNYYKDYSLLNSYAGTWTAPFYVWLGHYLGSNAGTTDITDTVVDWVRVRKYAATEPVTALGTKEANPVACSAFTTQWETAYSNVVPAATTTPGAPGLSATKVSENQITLSWTDTNTDESGAIIQRCTGSGCSDFKDLAAKGASVITYDDTLLPPNTTYRYQIRTYKAAPCAWSTNSNIVEIATTPSAPSGLAATAANTTQINLAWVDNTTSETGFTIERCSGAGCDFSVKDTFTVGANVITYSDTSACNSTTYSYRVKAVNSTVPWDSAYSNVDAGNTTPTPGVPVLTATRASEVQINLSWNDNNSDETGYKIDRCSDAACAAVLTTIPVAANTTAYSDTGLTAGTIYYYRVRAYKTATCGWDNAFYSNIANATTTIVAPGSLAATAANTTQINLAWTDNTASETGFTIERCAGAGCDFSVKDTFTVGANVITYSDASVCHSTTYSYRVKAVNSTVPWDSGYSNVDAGNTTPTPAAPGSLSATAVTDAQVDLAWTDSTADETGFKIERCTGTGCADFSQIGTTASNVSIYSDLTALPSTTYCYRARTYKTATCSWDTGYSNTACDLSISAHPINLTATALNSMKIRLDWADTSNDEDGFEIEVQVWNGRFVKIATVGPSVSTYTDTMGIEPQKQYIYRVRAYRSSDKSPYSNEASATTPAYTQGDGTCQ